MTYAGDPSTNAIQERSGWNAAGWFFIFFLAGGWLFTLGPYSEMQDLLGHPPYEVSGYSGVDFRLAAKQLSNDVRAAYIQTQLWDFLIHGILLTVAATKISLWVAFRACGSRSIWRNLGYFPVVLGITDSLENLLMLGVLTSPDPALWLANFAAVITRVKLCLVPTLLLLPLGVVAIWIWKFVPKLIH